MVIGSYISIITLNVNGLSAQIKRHRLAEWVQKQDPPTYVVYKWPTSHIGTQTEWKWGAGKRFLMQMEIKKKIKTLTTDNEGSWIDQGINPKRWYNNYK